MWVATARVAPESVRFFTGVIFLALGVAAAGVGGGGCGRDDAIAVYAVPKEAAPSTAPTTEPSENAPAAASATTPRWDVPAGWQQEPAKPMRVASFKTGSGADAAEVIVTQFAPNQFGGLLEN